MDAVTDARFDALRACYPSPTASVEATTNGHFTPNAPVEVAHRVFRNAAHGDGRLHVVDTLFPRVLEGRADTSGVDEGSADLLYGLIRALQPKVVLETGTHKGRSTRAIVQALQANAEVLIQKYVFTMLMAPGHLWTVDAEDHGILTSGAIPPEAAKYVTPILGWTPDVFTRPPLNTLQGIEFAFLDGDHSAAGLEADLEYVDTHRAPKCWVAVDNSLDPGWPGVAQTLRKRRYPGISLATCTGMDLLYMGDR